MTDYYSSHKNNSARKDRSIDDSVEVEISREMADEMKDNISQIRKYSNAAKVRFILGPACPELTERQKAVLLLRARGLSYQKIGDVLGISKSAAFKIYKTGDSIISSRLQ